MKLNNYFRFLWSGLFFFAVQSCGSLIGLPSNPDKSTIGEATPSTTELKKLPLPKEKIVIGVYKFRDQTGQYKPSESGNNWSTAVPQGITTILIKALEDSQWFIPIERENIANLLNERQIIRSTRQEYLKESDKNNALPPLLYAGILLEGGVISYDSNIMTGGAGARYFGIGASTQYRQDRITIYLRAVSTLNGEILKTVYTSKTILSTSVNGSFFRYVDTERLFEAEVGLTQNEPIQLAVTEAIEKAVKSLIIEGVRDKIWGKAVADTKDYQKSIDAYNIEQQHNEGRIIGDRYPNDYRRKLALFANVEWQQVKDDYANPKAHINGKAGIKYFFNKNLNAELSVSRFTLENTGILSRSFIVPEFNLEYLVFPQYKFSPYLYAGAGALLSKEKTNYKIQFGGGVEYLLFKNLGLRLSSQYDIGLNDDWDGQVSGKRKDQAVRIALGVNIYIGK
ncbi:curli production assembly protein CsgG [Elizabethkingia meningoseptica]|uniref:Curli production assembly protein CsgG n=1 Tax=Elizabethkingia meningoseptica TaxID=238 RepID=A0A1T3J2Y6_ELIME|nr:MULTISPECIES: CsgG/HfaB family protein [Elizabethkingia]AQX13100.1 curli production assembly protein CsgG [Elizabethkingia meningoseptica]MBG0514714.1 curli production assembly protein CsgG [Elizabethkingia meningoseptica]MDE5433550.1 curli production assembly protein CsgG [Elizabethkingia meningoseptica]MDE5448177.1 curli production assembly protein CsgG [Elizabethkingia meningoseptica]MDE5471082.1 curli production assembly protein CsgG [Elizabethkingia meningoseptica]